MCYLEGTEPDVKKCPEDGTYLELISEREAKWIDRIIDKKYRVVRLIGAGGMAEVFEVERISTQKHHALKLLKTALTADSHIQGRFRQEAMMISLIAHRNIVTLEDFGVLEGNNSYMVMELLHGYSLGDALANGPMQPESAFGILLQACEGMAAAHERGVLHRDLKPDNIYVHQEDRMDTPVVKILDLGIGKLFTGSKSRGLTLSGTVVGTPEYMSPEQCKGNDAGVPSDIYAMGIVLYEMLFGYAPFEDASPLLILPRQISETPTWDDELARKLKIPPTAKDVIFKALSKDPSKRQESMLDLQRDIAGLLSRLRRGVKFTLPSVESVKRSATVFDKKNRTASHLKTLPKGKSISKSVAPGPKTIAIEFTPDVYWVGKRHHSQLECNPYLRVFKGNKNNISMLIDPGPISDRDVVIKNISSVIGSVENLNYIFLNHEDPDVAGNAAELQRLNPDVLLICSEDTWRLARYYGLDEKRLISLESLTGQRIGLSTGHVLQFVPTPFCHSRGAAMMYDAETGVLFSGDLFGGTSVRDAYVFTDVDEDGILLFHQIYMPSQRAMTRALHAVSRLNPSPRVIAPQHGNIITEENVPKVIQMLKRLRVGMNLVEYNEQHPEMLALANEMIRSFARIAGKKSTRELLGKLKNDNHLVSQFEMRDPDQVIAFRIDSLRAMESLFALTEKLVPDMARSQLQLSIKAVRQRVHSAQKVAPG